MNDLKTLSIVSFCFVFWGEKKKMNEQRGVTSFSDFNYKSQYFGQLNFRKKDRGRKEGIEQLDWRKKSLLLKRTKIVNLTDKVNLIF